MSYPTAVTCSVQLPVIMRFKTRLLLIEVLRHCAVDLHSQRLNMQLFFAIRPSRVFTADPVVVVGAENSVPYIAFSEQLLCSMM